MTDEFVWGIFVADVSANFPNFYPVGLYSTKESAIKEILSLPRDHNYQLLQLPLNRNFAFYHKKNGKLVGMDEVNHEHFHFKDEDCD